MSLPILDGLLGDIGLELERTDHFSAVKIIMTLDRHIVQPFFTQRPLLWQVIIGVKFTARFEEPLLLNLETPGPCSMQSQLRFRSFNHEVIQYLLC